MNLISKQNRIRNNFYELNGKNVFHWNLRPLPLPRYNSSPIALIIFDWCFSARKFVIILILLIDWLCHCSCRSCSTCKAVQRVENCVFTQGQQWVVRFLGALFLEMFFFFFLLFGGSSSPRQLSELIWTVDRRIAFQVCLLWARVHQRQSNLWITNINKQTAENTINEAKANSLSAPRKSLLRISPAPFDGILDESPNL